MIMDTIAIHENRKSEKVVRFLNLDNFSDGFIKSYNNGEIYGVYYNDEGDVVALDIWGNEHKNILK